MKLVDLIDAFILVQISKAKLQTQDFFKRDKSHSAISIKTVDVVID